MVEDDPLIGMALPDSLEDAGAKGFWPHIDGVGSTKHPQCHKIEGALLDINLLRGEQSYQSPKSCWPAVAIRVRVVTEPIAGA